MSEVGVLGWMNYHDNFLTAQLSSALIVTDIQYVSRPSLQHRKISVASWMSRQNFPAKYVDLQNMSKKHNYFHKNKYPTQSDALGWVTQFCVTVMLRHK